MAGLVIDCFAGGGGASTGIEAALGRPCDIAVNHDPKAIAMHRANHPATHHVTEDIFTADLKGLVGGRKVDVMWASPDCTSHSKAKGGRPRESGLRILPWAVHKHAAELLPDVIFMENVEEIRKWGPLGADGRPVREREGEEYERFVDAMGALGYAFECRELSACDYGAPTTRRRWYAVLRRDGRHIAWPERTNGPALAPYVPASACIDFDDVGESIFGRARPLAPATMRRIERGVRRFVLEDGRPFTIGAGGGLRSPFITKFYKTGVGQRADAPLHTITTSQGHFGLVTAFLVKYYGTGGAHPVTEPLGTITTRDRFGLVTVELDGEAYAIADIRMRMLRPQELKLAQGFPTEYVIDRYDDGTRVPAAQQVRMIGNSVVPVMAERIVAANMGKAAEKEEG